MPADSLSLLDNVRHNNGSEGLKNYYHDLIQNDMKKALEMINDHELQFGTLFLLRQELSSAAVHDALDPVYRKALEIAAELTGERTSKTEKAIRSGHEDTASVLRWMIRTGYTECAIDEIYGQLMEYSAVLLTRSFKDTAVLPEIAEMIFVQQRNGKLIHELVWAFFEARSPESLLLIAQRLNSPDNREAALAKRLLCFIPEIERLPNGSGLTLYNRVLSWLQENRPFIFYTGESLNLSSLPIYYTVSWPAKYLCRPISVDNGEPLLQLNEFESKLASQFKDLPEQLQQKLADFSYLLYRRNRYQWNAWIRLPLNGQTGPATHMMGGLT